MFRKIAYILYQPYKWIIFFPLAFSLTFIFGLLAVFFSSLVNQRLGSFIGGVLWARTISLITPMTVQVVGKENIMKGQSYIVTPNHQSNFDIFALYGWIGLDIKWIMKKELRKIPGIGFGSKKVGHIFLDRSNHHAALKSLEEAKKKLVNGTSVVIFPEGTRGNGTTLLPFKRGAFKLAVDIGLPILPVTIVGTNKIMPGKTKTRIFPGKAKLIIHEAIDTSSFMQSTICELMNEVRTVIDPVNINSSQKKI